MLSIAIIWDKHIIEGERPIALSKRDGQKLRLVPRNEKILSSIPYLNAAFKTDHHFLEACSILEKLTPGKSPNRAELAWARSLVYLKAGNAAQALRDARFAMAYSPEELCQSKSEQTFMPQQMSESYGSWEIWRRCKWPSALEAAALALESLGQHSEAALHVAQAIALHHLQGNVIHISKNHWYQPLMDRLMAYMTVPHKRALVHGGARGLSDYMEQEREEALPEIRRTRPKNYYYERWMSGRVEREIPGLPSCIVSALVKKLDADDLDLMLIHPLGLSAQVTEMLHELTEKGERCFVDEFKPERLTWEEVKCLTGSDTVGLPIAYSDGMQESSRRQFLTSMTEDERIELQLEGQVNEGQQLRSRCHGLLKEARLRYETKQLPWREDMLVVGFHAGELNQVSVTNGGSCPETQPGFHQHQVDQVSCITKRRDIIIGAGQGNADACV